MFSLQYTELRTRVSKKMCLVNVSPESKEEKKDITDWYPISIYVYNLSNHYFEELISLAIQFLKLLKELQLYTASWYRPFSKPYNSTSDCWPQMQPIWIKPKKKNEKKNDSPMRICIFLWFYYLQCQKESCQIPRCDLTHWIVCYRRFKNKTWPNFGSVLFSWHFHPS